MSRVSGIAEYYEGAKFAHAKLRELFPAWTYDASCIADTAPAAMREALLGEAPARDPEQTMFRNGYLMAFGFSGEVSQ